MVKGGGPQCSLKHKAARGFEVRIPNEDLNGRAHIARLTLVFATQRNTSCK